MKGYDRGPDIDYEGHGMVGVAEDDPDLDYGAGLLTETQREYLIRNSTSNEWTNQQERTTRSRIRSRFVTGIWDLALLSTYLEERDLLQVAESLGYQTTRGPYLPDAINVLVRLAVLSRERTDHAKFRLSGGEKKEIESLSEQLETDIMQGIASAYRSQDMVVEAVDVDIEISVTDDSSVDNLGKYDISSLLALQENNEISKQELLEELEGRQEPIAEAVAKGVRSDSTEEVVENIKSDLGDE